MFRRLISLVSQIAIFASSGALAFLLRFEFKLDRPELTELLYALPIWIAVKTVAFHVLHLDRSWWSYASIRDVFRIGIGNLAGSIVGAVLIRMIAPAGFPRSIYLLDLIVCLHLTAGVRISARLYTALRGTRRAGQRKRVLIHGGGKAGLMLVHELWANPRLGFDICGFTDDDEEKTGIFIEGVKVLGTSRDLPALVPRLDIDQVLIAIPSATGAEMASILRHCHEAQVSCKTIPGLAEMIQGPGLAGQMRDVAVEDLLGRRPVQLDTSAISGKLEGKVIMVTGAAGSIGSELCRQAAAFRPGAIVAFDISETGLFYLAEEMRERFPDLRFIPEVGNIQNSQRLADVLEFHSPAILYHAAAYKHVPMMEAHLFEAVENNVLGTWNVAIAAALHGLTDFVMISSDKAVRPTSIMGLTKRVAELLVHSLQNGKTKFVSVRFGNVLGSNGSVVPIFKRQIAAGGPVRITHPEMRRYFMTTSEAVQLVLQASTMGKGGEIFVLDMGQPLKILDLAVNLILLSGLRPHNEIKIEFTGLRPGEKLSEELHTSNDTTHPTYHEKIHIYKANGGAGSLNTQLELLRSLCAQRQAQALLQQLKQLVPDYNPSFAVFHQLSSSDKSTDRKPVVHPSVSEAKSRAAYSSGNSGIS